MELVAVLRPKTGHKSSRFSRKLLLLFKRKTLAFANRVKGRVQSTGGGNRWWPLTYTAINLASVEEAQKE